MTSFNDIINPLETYDNDNYHNIQTLQIKTRHINKDNKDNKDNKKSSECSDVEYLEPLFNLDETLPNNQLAYSQSDMNIYYLDNNKVYNPTKTLGEYILKKHQCTTLHYMFGLENMKYNVTTTKMISNTNSDNSFEFVNVIENTNHYTNIGILSDHVGSGKSYCIMALLNEKKNLNNNNTMPFRNINIGSSNITINQINKIDTNILLVPHSLIGQWSKYLDKSGLKYYVVQKTKDVYGLGDKNCAFKQSKNNSEEENIKLNKNKTSKKGIAKKGIAKNNITEAKTDTTNETETKPKSKSKIVLKTKSKKESVSESVSESVPETPDIVATVLLSIKLSNNDKKQLLEQEKLEIFVKTRNIREQIEALRNDPEYRYIPNNENVVARNIIYKKITDLNKILYDLESKIDIINKTMKNCSLTNGIITDSQIQLINQYYILKNNPATKLKATNYLDIFQTEFLNNFSHINKPLVDSFDVILVSDSFYNLLSLYFIKDNYTVNRVIVDECNSIKGSQLLNINTIFTWLITSSINSLMTSTGYICKRQYDNHNGQSQTYNIREKTIMSTGFIFDTVCRLFTNNDNSKLYLINNPDYIKQSILLPELKMFIIICKDNIIIQVLNGIVSNDIMNMLNAGDIEGIINKLDAVSGDENNLVSIITQKYTEDLLIKEYEVKVAIENPKYKADNESIGLINKRLAIKDLKNKISCIEERVKNADSCPICIDDFINPIITPCCNNKYCFNCITMALNNKPCCPSCRGNIDISKLFIVSNKKDNEKNGKNGKNGKNDKNAIEIPNKILSYSEKLDYINKNSINFTKYENMDKIFDLNNNNAIKKYLIFTEYESTLNTKITSILDKWFLKYDRIRGSSATINKQIENYKNPEGETNVLLVNSKFFGSGINLENTTDIIIMHKMNKDIEMQAIGRAQRFGREGNLRVWQLYYQNEYTM